MTTATTNAYKITSKPVERGTSTCALVPTSIWQSVAFLHTRVDMQRAVQLETFQEKNKEDETES